MVSPLRRATLAVIGEPVELQVVLADETDGPAPPQAAGGQDDAGLPAGLPPELADDPLLRGAVQELGAVVRTARRYYRPAQNRSSIAR
jgi:hypothetical protein